MLSEIRPAAAKRLNPGMRVCHMKFVVVTFISK